MSPNRMVALAAFAAMLTTAAPARAAEAQDACVLLDPLAPGGAIVRLVDAREPCANGEFRMLVVASRTSLFDAQAKPPDLGTEGPAPLDPWFSATFLVTTAEAPLSTPLLVRIVVFADLDRAQFGSSREDGERIDASAVQCAMLVDGRQALAPVPLGPEGIVGLGVGDAVYDPPTGRFETLQWGDLPNAIWSQVVTLSPARGPHAYGVQCQAPASFRFLGTGTVDVLQ